MTGKVTIPARFQRLPWNRIQWEVAGVVLAVDDAQDRDLGFLREAGEGLGEEQGAQDLAAASDQDQMRFRAQE